MINEERKLRDDICDSAMIYFSYAEAPSTFKPQMDKAYHLLRQCVAKLHNFLNRKHRTQGGEETPPSDEETIVAERNRLIVARNRFRSAVVLLKEACEWVLGDDKCKRDNMGLDTNPATDSDIIKCVRESVAIADVALNDKTLHRP